jgi:hypothetical protein
MLLAGTDANTLLAVAHFKLEPFAADPSAEHFTNGSAPAKHERGGDPSSPPPASSRTRPARRRKIGTSRSCSASARVRATPNGASGDRPAMKSKGFSNSPRSSAPLAEHRSPARSPLPRQSSAALPD